MKQTLSEKVVCLRDVLPRDPILLKVGSHLTGLTHFSCKLNSLTHLFLWSIIVIIIKIPLSSTHEFILDIIVVERKKETVSDMSGGQKKKIGIESRQCAGTKVIKGLRYIQHLIALWCYRGLLCCHIFSILSLTVAQTLILMFYLCHF